ncbi:RHS repeat-associated core domain-containing protein (plasmid) [Pantoea agglomerans]|uniref:RHS repeat-associated core domain-containing protein n=1 Tax=Enterobacter agglomerans TaxID=549 RepID=UPI002ED37D13|nr:RHS repeat-associated core domain-containing protein [Pantoea agglomerans]
MTLPYSMATMRFIRHGHACLGVAAPDGLTLTAGGHSDSTLWSRNTASPDGHLHAWSPWGAGDTTGGLPGFNGERPDPVSGSYHLGNGYRTYSPALRRFTCPDSLSPFGAGGINPYAYCAGDPINRTDPTGHISWQGIVGIVGGIVGLGLSFIGGYMAIAAAEGIAAAVSSASATSLVVGGLGVAADVTAIASGATEDVNPAASSVLGWVSMATGIAGVAEGAVSEAHFRLQTQKYAYRLDFRSPDVILKEGFKGTNNLGWMNNVFGEKTVFTSKSLKGTSRFFLESVLDENVDGSRGVGALTNHRNLYPYDQKIYVYKVNHTNLDSIDVSKDLREVLSKPGSSRLYRYRKSRHPYNGPLKSKEDFISRDDHYFSLAVRLNNYNKKLAFYTDELIIRGPISPKRITLYQTL